MDLVQGNIIYISHGGGPMPILGDASHSAMIDFMKGLSAKIQRPKAIVVVSAHWEASEITIQSGIRPTLLYDYYGFPEQAYKLHYPCVGSPELANTTSKLLTDAGIPHALDPQRPYDHGTYIPLLLLYPEADIPVIQISLHHNLDPKTHLALGAALKPLLDQPILLIGSGFSFHNMREFGGPGPDSRNDAFQDSLKSILLDCPTPDDKAAQNPTLQALEAWTDLPSARYCHPREEHLLPLHVCVGASNGKASLIFDDKILGKRSLAFLW